MLIKYSMLQNIRVLSDYNILFDINIYVMKIWLNIEIVGWDKTTHNWMK
jgi:hypothetical protein